MATSPTTPQQEQALESIVDRAGFHAAYAAHRQRVYQYARSRVGEAAAEDVTAETFIQAWRARTKFEQRAATGLDAWLLGITTHVIARHRKAERRWLRMCCDTAAHSDASHEPVDTPIAERLDAERDAAALVHQLRRLPAREREPLLLHAIGQLSYEQIASALDIPLGTVRSRISRGRAKLQDNREDEHA